MSYWLNPKVESEAELEEKTEEICEVYGKAGELLESGVKLYSSDECTGLQAKERLNADRPLRRGKVRRVEYEYKRHGTLCLTVNFEVGSGRIESPTIGETRTELDFAGHILRTIKNAPKALGWWFIVDQLNTHKSETLVKIVASIEGIKQTELGIKGKSGILRSMDSRREFLEDPSHRLRFIYTPKHCSWLNQVEIWFSILTKKLIKWGNFKSKEDLKRQLEEFIKYFNETMAKPFKWTFKGFPLRI